MAGRVGITTRILMGYATLAIMAGLAVTASRGGWLAGTVGVLALMVFLLFHGNHRRRAFVVLMVLLVGGGIAAQQVFSKDLGLRERLIKNSPSGPGVLDWDNRIQMWKAAVEIWQEHPWWGAGPGQYDVQFPKFRPESFQMRPEHAHDDYLELFADWGLAGSAIAIAGVALFVVGLRKTWPHVRREENVFGMGFSNRYAFFLGAVCGLMALAAHSLVDFNLHVQERPLWRCQSLHSLRETCDFPPSGIGYARDGRCRRV